MKVGERDNPVIELLKNPLTQIHPWVVETKSIEERVREAKARSFTNLKWRYEVKEIGNNKYRVTQYAGKGVGPSLIRTWIVDLSTGEVKPENLAAKELYR